MNFGFSILDFRFRRRNMGKTFSLRLLGSCSDNPKSRSCPEPRRTIQNRKWAGGCVVAVAFALSGAEVEAQQPVKKFQRIAVLSPGSAPRPVVEALRHGLREFGYIDGQNVVFDYRYAEWNVERLPQLASELVKLKPDIIFTQSVTCARAAKQATSTIPIVIGAAGDLIQEGIIASLARPGGNVTGVTLLSTELEGKRLELLKETSRKLSRVAVLVNSANSAWENYPQVLEPAGGALKLRLERAEVRQSADLEDAFAAMRRNRADGVLVVSDPMFQAFQHRIAEFAARNNLPSISEVPGFAEAGGLIQYGLSIPEMGRQAAGYVDKILKGAKPADLPVERPTKFEFLINLKTAKQLGLTMPPAMLARADKVIK
jgi:putative tryptophan/tyrosine transport system substrate-binding protein